MNTPQLETALYRATISTFEDLALLFAEQELDMAHQRAQPTRAVSVGFGGAFEGHLLLRMTSAALASAAANMLGADLPPDDDVCADALGEIANVICGNVLPAIAGDDAVFQLSGPVPTDANGDAFRSAPLAAAAHVGLEDGRADVLLVFTPPAA